MNSQFALSYLMVSLTAMWFIYFVLWAGLRRERFRCQVRHIRDGLFDYMWENGHDFNEPAYRKAREVMNSVLALSNKLSPTALVAAGIAVILTWRCKGGLTEDNPLPTGPLGDKIRQSYLALAWTLIEYAFLKGIPGVFVRSVVWVLSHAFRLSSRVRAFKKEIVKDGADYLQGAGSGIQFPLKFT